MTHSLVAVVAAMLENPEARLWGYDLTTRAGVRSGVLYPILGRMLADGWLVDGWEDEAETGGKRPPRRYYTLTDRGLDELGALRARAKADPRFRKLEVWAF